ncbi:hypothetical protein BDR04DRAFT_1075395 [Suillus decipiens]|nr:hypothetical protein BDR04DRAFT_1075395 [Suillus decipiens]
MVNQPTANDTTSLAESTLIDSDVSSSPQFIVNNAAKRVKLILSRAKATPSESHSTAPEVIDVDVDENDAAPAAEQDDEADLNALKKTWRSAVYTFFKLDAVAVQYHDGRLVHFFPCGARKCKLSAGGVRRFQDSKDKSSTTNLRHHANGCWGKEVVDRAFSGGKVVQASRSVFSAFARKGQQLVHHTYRMNTSDEVRSVNIFGPYQHMTLLTRFRANLVRWITENNRPVNIINDRALRDLLLCPRRVHRFLQRPGLAFDSSCKHLGRRKNATMC